MKKLLLISILIILVVAIVFNIPYGIEAYRLEKAVAANAQLNRKNIDRIPVLMYHHISEDKTKWDSVTISPEKFREEMLYLKAVGYNTIHFKDYIDYVEQGKSLPDNPIIVTFDDGYLSNYQYAYPVLKQYDMKASIFIIGWSVGRKLHKDSVTPITEHFTWEQAKEMQQSGLIELQSHTYDLHNPSDEVNYGLGVSKLEKESVEQYKSRLETDAEKIEQLISQNIGGEVYAISYPYGSYNEYSESILKERGYRFTVTTQDGISDFGSSTYTVKRINMPSEIDSRSLIRQLLLKQQKNDYLPFEDEEDYQKRIKKLEKLYEVLKIYRSLKY
ncbi:MAG: hypothetical protein K0R84_2376 [Clostridia bacterium]|jgi:peptidoglycan/xylan/chitin deacetylase (PgdA/CDA1 family)|nr:hypothetical protein [Clostridia bacterium]